MPSDPSPRQRGRRIETIPLRPGVLRWADPSPRQRGRRIETRMPETDRGGRLILPRDSGEGGLKPGRCRPASWWKRILPRDSGEGGLKLLILSAPLLSATSFPATAGKAD